MRYVPVARTVDAISSNSDGGRPRDGRRSRTNLRGRRFEISGMTVIILGAPPDIISQAQL